MFDALHHAGVDVNVDAAPWIPGVGNVAALLNEPPAGVALQVSPLDIRHIGAEATFAGTTLTQGHINAAYEEHRQAIGEDPLIRWKSVAE